MDEFLRSKMATGLLLVSLVLNVFLLGMAAAPHVFGPPPPPMPLPPPGLMIERLADGLSDGGRTAMLKQFDAMDGELERLFAELNKSQSDSLRQFAEEPFDEAAYRHALELRKQSADRFFSAVADFFLNIGGTLSVDDRRRIAERGRI
ncbi:periplasmic heavy metal sensor [Dongia sp.]|uniref:periplasmic heavy metal sensor n=1 Tax=Dongia sp. TaxID=1977262 RepID=UPI0035B1908C